MPLAKTNFKQLACNVGTKVVGSNEYSDNLYPFSELTPKGKKAKNVQYNTPQTAMIFNAPDVKNEDIFYLCEYIPRNRIYADTRSHNLVLGFKDGNKDIIKYVAKKLAASLKGNCALVAIPPSKTERNNQTSVHELIRQTIEIAKDKNIIDASNCLVRTQDIVSAHTGGSRSMLTHFQSIAVQHPEKIRNRDVLIIDDVVTTGNSLMAAKELISEYARNTVFFAVGRTVDVENLSIGFILDIDGTLFDTERGRIKQCRDNRQWKEAYKIAEEEIEPVDGAVELINKIRNIHAEFRLVTSSIEKYASILAKKLDIKKENIIAFHDTVYHKPDVSPYVKAKQRMKIYEPMIVVIGDCEEDKIPADKLGMIYIDCKKHSIADIAKNFYNYLEPAYHIWEKVTNDYTKNHPDITIEKYQENYINKSQLPTDCYSGGLNIASFPEIDDDYIPF